MFPSVTQSSNFPRQHNCYMVNPEFPGFPDSGMDILIHKAELEHE